LSVPGSLDLLLAEAMLTAQVSALACMGRHSSAWTKGTAKSSPQGGDHNLDTSQFMDQHV